MFTRQQTCSKCVQRARSPSCLLKTAHSMVILLWLVVLLTVGVAKSQKKATQRQGQSNALLFTSNYDMASANLQRPQKPITAVGSSKHPAEEVYSNPVKAKINQQDLNKWSLNNHRATMDTILNREPALKTDEDKHDETEVRFQSLYTRHPHLERLKYSQHYGRIRVKTTNNSRRIYLTPHDFFRCGHCICFKPEGHDDKVHADCIKYKNHVILSIPDYLPDNIFRLDMDYNPIRHFETNVLARYKSLLTVKAPHNKFRTLHAKDCLLVVNVQYLDLSYNNLSTVEDGALSCMPNLTQLILKRNLLTALRNATLAGLGKLIMLNLAKNKIHTIEAGAFLPSASILDLDLSANERLSLNHKYVETFRPLASLKILYIQGCTSLGGNYPTDVLLALPNLQELTVNGEKHAFDSKLSALGNLTKLTLGKSAACWTKNFTKAYFNGLAHLRSLTIYDCRAKEYSPHMFDDNPRITEFELAYEMRDMKNVFPILCYLSNLERIRSVKIIHTRKHALLDPLITLSPKDVECLNKMKHLVSLSLEHNAISQVGRVFALGLPPSLETLNLRGNLLISFQSMMYLLTTIPQILPNLKVLREDNQGEEPDHNPGNSLEQEWPKNSDLEDYSSRRSIFDLNSIEAQTSLLVARKPFTQNFDAPKPIPLNSSKYLDVYSATNVFNFGLHIFDGQQRVQSGLLNVSSTLVTNWGVYPVLYMPKLTVIADLSDNRCEYLKNTFFLENNSLVELYAGGNFLGPQLSKDENGTKFAKLTNLEVLDLSRNHVFYLPWLLFKGLPNVRVLNLASNNIETFHVRIQHMKSLLFVDLSKNSLTSISENTRDELDSLARIGPISIDLTYNPLPCTCGGYELLRWMSLTQVRILNKDFLTCENKTELVGDLSERVLALQRLCISRKLLIMAASFSCAILFFIVGFVWVFQKRWWILYTWNRAVSHFYGYKTLSGPRARRRRGEDISRERSVPQYTFDAFFVYTASTCDFVLDKCLDELEVVRSHRLCVEDRDFLPGSYLPCNITSAVRSSRTTVVVIDENFRSAGWTQYAVEMAQVEAVRSKRNVLHLLLVGSPPDGHLPNPYLKVFRQGQFSELPPDECSPNVHRKFWDSFSQMLGHTDGSRSGPSPRLVLSD
ncbi:Toll-like receptor m [Elysia marginata]|uniref:Toll-like receptor m n=1 Tax=Elysia marginata TaxID=1093978 RepID=A0AAV4HYV7_9GAST|nr:Toll-like receptor m [Elysia marginata]